ncbi:MAG: WD40/YVTN/BNR-like repeat-containing protein, partial [Candidatus Thorarchaeota archaeon]
MRRRSYVSLSISILFLIVPFVTITMSSPSIENSFYTTQVVEMPPWVRTNGPYGGLMNCIEIDPSNPNTLYAVGAGSDIFKSTNGGTNWYVVGTLPMQTPQITDLVISESNPQIMYLQTVETNLYRSTNGGVNWSRINIDPIHQGMAVFHFALHPMNSSIIVAIMWNAFVYKTINAGQTWVNVSGNLPREPDMTTYSDIAISGDDEYWVGVGAPPQNNGSLYHTIDGGITWEKEDLNQAPGTFISSIMIHPDISNTVYVSLINSPDEPFDIHTSYLSMTDDGGTSWQQLNTTATLHLLAIVPSENNDTIYASYGPVVFSTKDYGYHWDDITVNTATSKTATNDINDIAVDPT